MAKQTRKNSSNKPQAPLTKFVVLGRIGRADASGGDVSRSWHEFREPDPDGGLATGKIKIVEARTDTAAIAQLIDPLKDFGSYKAIPLRSWKGGVTYAEPQSVANKQPLDEEFGA